MFVKHILILLGLLLLALSPVNVSAHIAGQPPFFTINGTFSDLYPIQPTTIVAIDPFFPQDLAKEEYLVNSPVTFELVVDELQKVVPVAVINKTVFRWDFGDDTSAIGLKNTHTYQKPGTYVLTIRADTTGFEPKAEPQIIQSVLFHILPNNSYQLPTPVISVNGRVNQDTEVQIQETDLSKTVRFDGSHSLSGTSTIRSYQWDFGDQEVSNERIIAHKYRFVPAGIQIILRVTDELGFYVDRAVGFTHNALAIPDMGQSKNVISQEEYDSIVPIVIIFTCVVLFIVWIILRQIKAKKLS